MAPGTVEIAIVVGLFFILFGPTQLPKLARSLGQAKTEFNRGLTEGGGESILFHILWKSSTNWIKHFF